MERLASARALLEFVGLRGKRAEAGLEEVVRRRGGQRPGQQAAGPGRDRVDPDDPRCRPHPDAAAACEQLADRLTRAAVLDRLLVPFVRLTLHERLSQEAQHLVVSDRPRGLERRGREHCEVERRQVLEPPAAERSERADARHAGAEDAHQGGIGRVRGTL